jgi:hypothetical protein
VPEPIDVDQLIRELIGSRVATPRDVESIIERMATAPFDSRPIRVPVRYRGLTYRGRALSEREESLFYHLVKRVLIEEQWSDGTTAAEYLADLRQAVRSPDARLLVYRRRGGPTAAVLAPNLVPTDRRGPKPQPFLYVVYSADRSIIVSGYQASGLAEISVPADARWLK